MSLRTFGERVGLAYNTISKLETGQQTIAPKYLEQFAEVFGCEPRDLLPRDPARARLDDAVNARDVDAIVEALAELGIELPVGEVQNPSAPTGDAAAVDAMVAAQLRASAAMLEERSADHIVYIGKSRVEDRDPLTIALTLLFRAPPPAFVENAVRQVKHQFDGLAKKFEASTRLLQVLAVGGLLIPKGTSRPTSLEPAALQELLKHTAEGNPALAEELGAALGDLSEQGRESEDEN